ncbi:MAG: ABC transporter substrate-binding protein [Spirochaetaceae bacterium]|jgi:NitT/TauT family transport system substrate-binding protein|nr:ABC transporter substrate-binding protein [Spirochaetaceae bacterium]
MKRFFGVLAMISVVALLLSVSACKKKDTVKVEGDYVFKIGYALNNLCHAPLYIAADKGYYKEEGLDWDIIQFSDGEVMNLLTSGSIDASSTLMIGLIQPLANGLPVQIPLAMHTGCIKVLVPPESLIKTAADLKGKTIGVASPSANPGLFTKRYLAGKGFKVEGENADIEFIYQSPAELPLLLERGLVDAIGLTDPAAQISQDTKGFRAIIDSGTDDDYKDEFCCVIPVRAATVKEHPEATAKFLRAVQKASMFIQQNPDEAAKILADAQRIAGDPVVNAKIFKTFNYRASVSQALPALERNARSMQEIGILNADVDVDKLVKDVYVVVPGVPDSLF